MCSSNTVSHRRLQGPHAEEYKNDIERRLSKQQKHSWFYKTLSECGMRVNAGLGLSLESVVFEPIKHKVMANALKLHGFKYYGYIVLKDQPDSKKVQTGKNKLSPLRNSKGHVPRKPLKGRRTIEPKNNRIIPILSEGLAQVLRQLVLRQKSFSLST